MRVLVVTSEWPSAELPVSGPWIVVQVDALRAAGVDVDVLPFRGARRPSNYLRARSRVRQALRTGVYDLVHAHFGQSGLLVVPSPLPFVVTFHGSDLEGIVGRSGRYTALGWFLRQLSRVVARAADAVIVVAPQLGERLPSRVTYEVMPMGVDTTTFAPGDRHRARAALGLPPESRSVLFCGDPAVARKRFALAQSAVEILGDRLDARLITVTGVPPDVVRTYMVACDALLVTAMHEGSPVMVKEALVCNLPVAAVDVGDVGSLLNGIDGCEIAASEDPRDLANALERVLSRQGSFDGRSAVERFGSDRLAADLIALYERTIGTSSR